MPFAEARWRWAVLGVVLLAGVAVAVGPEPRSLVRAVKGRWERTVLSWSPPAQGEARPPNREAHVALASLSMRGDARILWSSNRSGNHELYLRHLGSGQTRRLTNASQVDFYGRFSPDGRQIVFMRSHHEWVSFRQVDAWDVYVMNTDGSGARRLVERGYHPNWTADGSGIVFARGDKILRVDPATGQESEVLDVGGQSRRIRYGDAELSHQGSRLAVSVDGSETLIFGLGGGAETVSLGKGTCQPTWALEDEYVLWVAAEGHGGTRIMRDLLNGSAPTVFMDLPGAYSHEYFPRVSNDGRWLTWAASAKGHEHDRADYEIFLWRIGDPWETAVRLTHHTGNDQWPDIHVEGP